MTSGTPRTTGAALTGEGLVLPADAPGQPSAVAAAHHRYLAATCQRFLDAGSELPSSHRAAHARLATLVRDALARQPRQTLACFASPTIGTPLQCLSLRGELGAYRERIDAAASTLIPHVALELTLRQLVPPQQSFDWTWNAPTLTSLALSGELIPPAAATGLRFGGGGIVATASGAELATFDPRAATPSDAFRLERRFWRIARVSRLATIDFNPIASFEAHPDKSGNHIDLGERTETDWVEMLETCFALIGRYLPGEYAEMSTLLHQLIPVGYDAERHLSASYREAIGTVYLTLHPSVMTMTEAVVHEFQHNKINLAAHAVDFLHNAFSPLYKSPIRPDPRPLWGILLAVHAFLPVAELYRRMRDGGDPLANRPGFDSRLAEIDLKNHEGMEMLRQNAVPTEAGRVLLAELETLEHRHLAERRAKGLPNTPTAVHLA